jgi:hypothetical protein
MLFSGGRTHAAHLSAHVWRNTREAGGLVSAALARIAGECRIWPLHRDAFSRVIVLIFRGHDLRRSHTILDPVRERRHDIVCRILRGCRQAKRTTEGVRTNAAAMNSR